MEETKTEPMVTREQEALARDLERVLAAKEWTGEVSSTWSSLLERARVQPDLFVPYAKEIAGLMDSASDQLRKGSIETLAVLSRVAPGAMAFLLPKLHMMLAAKPEDLAGEHAIEILSNYAKTSRQAAERVLPIIASTIDKYGTKNVVKALGVLQELGREVPKLAMEIVKIGDRFQKSVIETVRKAAQNLR